MDVLIRNENDKVQSEMNISSLCASHAHASEDMVPLIPDLGTNVGDWYLSRHGRPTPGREPSIPLGKGGWVGPTADPDVSEKM